jgi:hypothetical protein
MTEAIEVRPYQLLCLFCAVGQELPGERGEVIRRLGAAIKAQPDTPITLRCNALDVYTYQDNGAAADTPESGDFNRKRDLDILYALDLAPGSTLPARTLLYRVMRAIPTTRGVCGDAAPTAGPWQGCSRAAAGHYERGLAAGIEALIPPRCPEEMRREKQASVAAMQSGGALRIRPHVAMCAVCHYGAPGGEVPIAADNIVEFIRIIRERPETLVTLAQGADWMICAPCGRRVPELNACVNVYGSGGLSNEKRDLDVLKRLGLTYGATLPGREFLRLLFERIPTTQPVCRRDSPSLSVWWDGCGEANRTAGNTGYDKGRERLLREWAGQGGAD